MVRVQADAGETRAGDAGGGPVGSIWIVADAELLIRCWAAIILPGI